MVRVLKAFALAAAIALAWPAAALATCNGQFTGGQVCGNPGSSLAQPTATGLSGLFDRNFGAPSAQGTILNRGASVWSATANPTLGLQQTTQGSLILANTAAGAYATTIKSSNSASVAWTMTLPPNAGTNGYVLTTNGSGATSWTGAGGAITSLTGDVTGTGPGATATTLATVNSGPGSVGSSTAIPVLTTNGKGLVTAQTTAAVIAPAGTLTGATLASGVTASSLTSFGNAPALVSPAITGSPTGVGSIITINFTNCQLATSCTIPTGSIATGVTVVNGGPGVLSNASSGGFLQSSTTLPSGLSATNLTLVTPTLGVASATSLASGPIVITSASANALAVGLNGSTHPALNVDDSTATSATGLNIKSAAATGGLALSVISSGGNENLTIDALGSGTIGIGSVSTGAVTITPATTITGALTLSGGLSAPLSLTNGGTNNTLTASAGGIVWSDASKLNIIAGTVTAGQCLLSGDLATPTWGSCSGAAAVSAVSNADGTLTISPTTGSVVASLALGHANTWTGAQTFGNGKLVLAGSSSGAMTLEAPAVASTYVITFPAVTSTAAVLGQNQTFTSTQTFSGTLNVSGTFQLGGNAFSTNAALAVTAGTTGQLAYWSSGTAIGGASLGNGLSLSGSTINTPWTVSSTNIYNNNAGNVGIGTSSPAVLLHVHTGTNQNFGVQTPSAPGVILNSFNDALSAQEPMTVTASVFNLSAVPLSIGGTVQYTTPQVYDASCGTAGYDCTTGFNSFLAVVATGVKGYVPNGTYDTATTFAMSGAVNGCTIEGAGYGAVLRSTVATGTQLTLGDGTNTVERCLISNLRFTGSVAHTGGQAILARQLNQITFSNLWFDSNINSAMTLSGTGANSLNQININNVQILNCASGGNGIVAYSTGASAQFFVDAETYISGCGFGIYIGGGMGGVYLDAGLSLNNVGLYVTSGAGGLVNREVFMTDHFTSDSNTSYGVYFTASSMAPGGTIRCIGCWSSGNGGIGLSIASQGGLENVIINGGQFNSNGSNPIYYDDASGNVSVVGNSFNGNATGNNWAAGAHACAANVGSNVSAGC